MNRLLACVLAFGLAGAPGVAQNGDKTVELKPGMIVVCAQKKGKVGGPPEPVLAYVWDGKTENKPAILRMKSKLQDITAFVVAQNGQQYFLDGLHGTPDIMQADKAGQDEKKFYVHEVKKELLRDLALDDDDNLYFSVAGGYKPPYLYKIYKVRSGTKDKAATAELFCDVPDALETKSKTDAPVVHWGGNFAFGRTGTDGLDTKTLYLSVRGGGGYTNGWIFRMTQKDGQWSKPELVFKSAELIDGLVFTSPREAYFVATKNFTTDPAKTFTFHVYRLTDLKKSDPVLTLDGVSRIFNVSLVRGETRLLNSIMIPDSKK
jgi:hypothetical protein